MWLFETIHRSIIVSFCLCFAATLAGPVIRSLHVHEARELPAGFTHAGAAPDDDTLNLRIALAQNDPEGLIQALMDVSTPSSQQYGQHLSKTQVSPLKSHYFLPG